MIIRNDHMKTKMHLSAEPSLEMRQCSPEIARRKLTHAVSAREDESSMTVFTVQPLTRNFNTHANTVLVYQPMSKRA